MHATKVVSILPPRLNQLAWSFGFVYDTVDDEGSKYDELGWSWRKQHMHVLRSHQSWRIHKMYFWVLYVRTRHIKCVRICYSTMMHVEW